MLWLSFRYLCMAVVVSGRSMSDVTSGVFFAGGLPVGVVTSAARFLEIPSIIVGAGSISTADLRITFVGASAVCCTCFRVHGTTHFSPEFFLIILIKFYCMQCN